MKKKLFSLILACLMLAPAAVSCGNNGSDKDETSKSPSKNTQSATSGRYDYIDDYVDDLAAQYKYDGITFSMIDNGTSFPEEYEESGNLEDDALFYRYRELEEKFGIEMDLIERTEEGTDFNYSGEAIADDVYRDVMAGGSSYDLICGGVISCGQNLVNKDSIRSASDLPGLDFENSWWVDDIDEKFSIAGNLYYLTGKIVDSHYGTPSMVVYSKQVAENYNITENLYEVVEAGEWTIDKMCQVASVIPTNSTMDGDFRYVWHGSGAGYAFYEAGGFSLTSRDENNNPTVAASLSPEQIDYIQKLGEIFGDKTQNFDEETYIKENGYDQPGSDYNLFSEQRFLFTISGLGGIKDLRDANVEIGILPMPKRDADQEEYRAFSSGWGMFAVYFSKNLKNEEMSGVITEAMAALSEKHLEPAYYEKALQGRSTYDVESRDMLDIVYNNMTVDLTECYEGTWGDLYVKIGEAVMGESDSVTSSYNSGAKVVNIKIKSMIQKIEKTNAAK